MRENKKTLISRSLIRSIRFIVEFIIELLSAMALMFFIVFRDSLELEKPFHGLMNELWEGGIVLTQKS